ncbi:MAG: hypothetical protein JKY03_06600 [Aureispira sp.]|nr:hypothetical protein [Aureispira sp.]
MSTDTNNTNNNTPDPEAKNNASNALSAKDKFIHSVKKNKKPILGISAAVILIIICLILYFNFAGKSMNELADDFCTCASVEGSDFYAYGKDGFGYRSDLVGCFAEDFRNYGKRYNKATKKALLIEFQQEVIKKCPEKLADVFEYK